MDKDEQFKEHLLETYKIEAEEHLNGISLGLIALEKNDEPEKRMKTVEVVFREAHSLKGASRAVNLREIESLCQAMESLFSALLHSEIAQTKVLFDSMQMAVGFMRRLLPNSGKELLQNEREQVRTLIHRLEIDKLKDGTLIEKQDSHLENTSLGNESTTLENVPFVGLATATVETVLPMEEKRRETSGVMSGTVRVSTTKLSSVLLQSEEMLSAKLEYGQRVIDMRTANAGFRIWKKEWSSILPVVQEFRKEVATEIQEKRGVQTAKMRRELGRILDFIEWNAEFMKIRTEQQLAMGKALERDSLSLGGMVNGLLDDMKALMMVPFSALLETIPSTVRELSGDSGKDVNLVIRGGDLEIDRRILDALKEPILHLVRNCIDHGLETREERLKKGKPIQGTLVIEIYPKDNRVEVLVADDGAGIMPESVRDAMLQSGAVAREKIEELSDVELLKSIFRSGVSTSSRITEISGRGLGLAIVREKVEMLGGTVFFETEKDVGTQFHMALPLTVVTFRGILVRSVGRDFVFPTMYVERVLRMNQDVVKSVENCETIELDGQPVSLVWLSEVLELSSESRMLENPNRINLIVLDAEGTRIAFLVDAVISEQEVLLKPLGRQLSRIRNISGATVMGNGQVVPIINVPDLLKSASHIRSPKEGRIPVEIPEFVARKRSVLIAEDSITTRSLLKNILEAAGFEVVTAVDGLDAFALLKTRRFDIVVSDVEMPRMDGFELVTKIRSDLKLSELPVVLVTAQASREDQERGIDVGANAYIVKSGFDQNNLLDAIGKLMIKEALG